ncbi:MAG: hypothetical protein JXB25_07470 [Deltaproteobacteria bacterium]|nr:hypothetical protein [Deltaproteobacteria bacterium]
MDKINFLAKLPFLVIFISAIVTFISCAPIASENAKENREYISTGNYFKCNIPDDWNVYIPSGFGLSEEERKVYGGLFSGPYAEGQDSPEISVYYYAPGNLLEKTMDVFIRRHAGTGFFEGRSYQEVKEIEFSGRKAKNFESIRQRNLSGRVLNPVFVTIFQKFIVVPAKEGEGFYVLRLAVPFEIKDQYIGTFDEVSKSFVPSK